MSVLTSQKGALWIQPDGPNGDMKFLGCHDLDDLTIPEGGIELIRCFNPAGGWDVVGHTETPPDKITVSVTTLIEQARDWLEKVHCPFGLYILQRDCGRADQFSNYIRGDVLMNVRRVSRTKRNLVKREEDLQSELGVDLEAYPPAIAIEQLEIDLQTTTADQGLNDVAFNLDRRCIGDCGAALDPCEDGIAVGDSAIAPALADIVLTGDEGDNWAAVAADPFAAGAGAMSVVRFYVGRDTERILVAMDAPAAAQGMVAYSDDGGVTWTTVNIGGAAAGDGAVYGGGLWALDMHHVWLAGANGYIYFSDDGGETWTVLEAGAVTAGDYNCVHFADELYGIAGAPGDVIALSNDGGITWAAATATGGGGDILCAWRLDKNRMWVGTDDGDLYYSQDGGVTWTQRTGWTGSGVGAVRDMFWVNDYVGFIASNNVTPVGTVLRTINGGRHWEALTTPDNDGLNAIWACDESNAFVVGEVEAGAGTAVILHVRAA